MAVGIVTLVVSQGLEKDSNCEVSGSEAFCLVELPKSLQVLEIERCEFEQSVAICLMYIEV